MHCGTGMYVCIAPGFVAVLTQWGLLASSSSRSGFLLTSKTQKYVLRKEKKQKKDH